jgi:hypothetical protein
MIDGILAWLVGYLPLAQTVLMIIGSLVVAAQAYIVATPSQDDDAWFAKIEAIPVVGDLLVALQKFAVIQRK